LRERWSSRTIFIMAAVGSAVGLGNAWRFPGMAYNNGGGAFLIPYFVALITAGIPLLLLEISIGKKFQTGAPSAFAKIHKGFEGLGWWAVATGFVIVSYYTVILAWSLNYIWSAFTVAWSGGAEGYFYNNILQITDSPGILGGFSLPVLGTMVLAWIAVWWCIRHGVKSVGKVVKWTVLLPVALMIVLAIRALTLPGAIEGLNYYLKPDFSALLDVNVWAAAFGQIFFTLSVLFGVMIAYGSYLSKDSDTTTDTVIIAFADAGISFLAGFAVFGTLGYIMHTSGVAIGDMSIAGVGLAFVTYPEAISQLPGGALVQVIFGLMFFLMLFTLGIDSAFSIVEGVVTGLVDKFKWNRSKTLLAVCFAGFAGGLIFATKAGLYWLDIVDYFTNNFNLIVIGIIECLLVGWVYGAGKMRAFFNETGTIKFGKWWDLMIRIVTPLALLVISVMWIIENINTNYEGYESIHLLLGGWIVVAATIVIGFVMMLFKDRNRHIPADDKPIGVDG